jgi:hypothetical protein
MSAGAVGAAYPLNNRADFVHSYAMMGFRVWGIKGQQQRHRTQRPTNRTRATLFSIASLRFCLIYEAKK